MTNAICVDFATITGRLSTFHKTALDGCARLRLNAVVINDDGIAGRGANCNTEYRAQENGTPRDGRPPAGAASRDDEMPRFSRSRSPARGSDIASRAAMRPVLPSSRTLDPLLAPAARGASAGCMEPR